MSRLLKEHDIFITASENDPCSNSLIEAMHCGLPAVALNSGGHPEIIKKGGELFNKKEEIIPALNKIISNYSYYQEKIELPGILEVAKSYKDFSHKVLSCSKKNKYRTKRVNIFNRIRGALMSIY
jgi:glycosyltransferase involved in cell wall biosynthesis